MKARRQRSKSQQSMSRARHTYRRHVRQNKRSRRDGTHRRYRSGDDDVDSEVANITNRIEEVKEAARDLIQLLLNNSETPEASSAIEDLNAARSAIDDFMRVAHERSATEDLMRMVQSTLLRDTPSA